ncbi:hypothetical protein Trydic_g11224 [Trypoxylus dichotomus]
MDSGSKTEQISEDTSAIKEMFSALNIKVDTISPIRLEKYNPTSSARRRLVRIRLPHTDAVADVIRLSGKLKSIDKFKLVSLSRDRAPAQIGYYKRIKQQLTDRTLAGEVAYQLNISTVSLRWCKQEIIRETKSAQQLQQDIPAVLSERTRVTFKA